MITKFKKQLEPVIAIIAQPFLSWNPHMLTLLSVIFACAFFVSLVMHNYFFAAIAWVGVIFDALDGYVARKKGKTSQFGAFFDSTMDRISDFFFISAFGFAGLISWPLVMTALLSTFLISYAKARGESLLPKDRQITDGIMQRTERLVVLFVVFLLFVGDLPYFALVLFSLLVGLTLLTFLQRVLLARKLLA